MSRMTPRCRSHLYAIWSWQYIAQTPVTASDGHQMATRRGQHIGRAEEFKSERFNVDELRVPSARTTHPGRRATATFERPGGARPL